MKRMKTIVSNLSSSIKNFIFQLSKLRDLAVLESIFSHSSIYKLDVIQYPDHTMIICGSQVCSVGAGESDQPDRYQDLHQEELLRAEAQFR